MDALIKLITDYGNASFDCGSWVEGDDDLGTYEDTYKRYEAAKAALFKTLDLVED